MAPGINTPKTAKGWGVQLQQQLNGCEVGVGKMRDTSSRRRDVTMRHSWHTQWLSRDGSRSGHSELASGNYTTHASHPFSCCWCNSLPRKELAYCTSVSLKTCYSSRPDSRLMRLPAPIAPFPTARRAPLVTVPGSTAEL